LWGMSGDHLHRWLVGRVVLRDVDDSGDRWAHREADCSDKRPRGLPARRSSGQECATAGCNTTGKPGVPLARAASGGGAHRLGVTEPRCRRGRSGPRA
jgi:hypothetical protein